MPDTPHTAAFSDHLFVQYMTGAGTQAFTPCQRCRTPFVTRNWVQYPPCVERKPVDAAPQQVVAEVA